MSKEVNDSVDSLDVSHFFNGCLYVKIHIAESNNLLRIVKNIII